MVTIQASILFAELITCCGKDTSDTVIENMEPNNDIQCNRFAQTEIDLLERP